MAELTKTGLNICEIDSQYPSQTNSSSCDCGCYGSKTNNCFFNFDSINGQIAAGSVVTSAVLRLAQVSGGYSATQSMLISLRYGPWGAFKWNSQPTNTTAAGVSVSLSGTGAGSRDFNVTSLVQWIVANNSSAHIFKMERVPNNTSGSNDAKRFSTNASSHQLLVTYTPPTAPTAPTGVGLSPHPFEGTLSASWTKGSNGVNNPVNGHDVQYRTSSNGSSWSAAVSLSASAAATSLSIPAATVSGWARGTYVQVRVGSKSAYAATVYSGWSASVRKNRLPATPTGAATAKTCYAPGETIRVTFASTGDEDGNLSRFEAALSGSETILATQTTVTARHVDISTASGTWTPGAAYQFRVRARDALGVLSAWSAPTPAVMVGLPMHLRPAAGGVFRRAVSMKVMVPGLGFKTVKGAKIAPAQGGINKTVF